MNALYADPIEIDVPFILEIFDNYPAKKFHICCLDGKKRAMSGTTAGFVNVDKFYNTYLDFHIFLKNPRSCSTLRIEGLQSIYFDRMLGYKVGYKYWKFECTVTYDKEEGFLVIFPNGILKAKNVTG
jgi:hypothetical protein